MKRTIALIYWVYISKKSDIPYWATCMTVVGLTFMHLCQIALIFGITSNIIFPFDYQNAIINRWLNVSYLLTPMIILFLLVFKKRDLISYTFDENTISKGRKTIPVYFFISLLILCGLAIKEGIKKGTF